MTSCSKKQPSSEFSLYNNAAVVKRFAETKAQFFTPPTFYVDEEYFTFSGWYGNTAQQRMAGWKSAREAIYAQIMDECLNEAADILDSWSIGASMDRVGFKNKKVLQPLLSTDNIVSLQLLLAEHEMHKRMTKEFASQMIFRELQRSHAQEAP